MPPDATPAYYDAAADDAARSAYYAAVDLSAPPDRLAPALASLVSTSHTRRVDYAPSVALYPWVDLHPDGLVHHIYSGRAARPEDLVQQDAQTAQRRAAVRAAGDALDERDPRMLYNCEHVVPQSWFGKQEPMRGDLHHLFACEPDCNAWRGNTPYADLTGIRTPPPLCGQKSDAGFEPLRGRGPVARATLYFLLRYPGLVGDQALEMNPEQVVPVLVRWHEADAVAEYEMHRNQAIQQTQGNRNPFVDHPGLAAALAGVLSRTSG